MTDAAKLMAMARYLARKAVKERLWAKGIRTLEVDPSEINRATDIYLMVHKVELIAEAKAILSR